MHAVLQGTLWAFLLLLAPPAALGATTGLTTGATTYNPTTTTGASYTTGLQPATLNSQVSDGNVSWVDLPYMLDGNYLTGGRATGGNTVYEEANTLVFRGFGFNLGILAESPTASVELSMFSPTQGAWVVSEIYFQLANSNGTSRTRGWTNLPVPFGNANLKLTVNTAASPESIAGFLPTLINSNDFELVVKVVSTGAGQFVNCVLVEARVNVDWTRTTAGTTGTTTAPMTTYNPTTAQATTATTASPATAATTVGATVFSSSAPGSSTDGDTTDQGSVDGTVIGILVASIVCVCCVIAALVAFLAFGRNKGKSQGQPTRSVASPSPAHRPVHPAFASLSESVTEVHIADLAPFHISESTWSGDESEVAPVSERTESTRDDSSSSTSSSSLSSDEEISSSEGAHTSATVSTADETQIEVVVPEGEGLLFGWCPFDAVMVESARPDGYITGTAQSVQCSNCGRTTLVSDDPATAAREIAVRMQKNIEKAIAQRPPATPAPKHRRTPSLLFAGKSGESDERSSPSSSSRESDESFSSPSTVHSSSTEDTHGEFDAVDTRFLFGYCATCATVVEYRRPWNYQAGQTVFARCSGCQRSIACSDKPSLVPSRGPAPKQVAFNESANPDARSDACINGCVAGCLCGCAALLCQPGGREEKKKYRRGCCIGYAIGALIGSVIAILLFI